MGIFDKYQEKIRKLFLQKDKNLRKDKILSFDKKRTVENLIILIIIGIVIIISGRILFGGKEKGSGSINSGLENETYQEVSARKEEKDDLEEKMESILSRIEGAGKVEVMITYMSNKELVPAYNSKVNESSTVEKDSEGGTRNIIEKQTEKNVIYEEGNNLKKPLIIKEMLPEIKGVVVVAEGAKDLEVKDSLLRAAQVLAGVPIHKVQVFAAESR